MFPRPINSHPSGKILSDEKLTNDLQLRGFRNNRMNSMALDKSYKQMLKEIKSKNEPIQQQKSSANLPANSTSSQADQNEWKQVNSGKKRRLSTTIDSATPTSNMFSPLESQNNEEESMDIVTENQQVKSLKLIRPPPINTHNVPMKKLIDTLKDKVLGNSYRIKNNIDNNHIVYVNDMDSYSTIKKLLLDADIKYYSYTPKQDKMKNIVLKGLNADYTAEEIQNELVALNLEGVTIIKVEMMKKRAKHQNLQENGTLSSNKNYIVQFKSDSKFPTLSKIRTLLQQVIYWEPLRKPKIFQCFRCQRVGHASVNCVLQPRCVKCSNNHEKGQCKLKEKINKDVKCANCGEAHPASYRGCSYLIYAEKKSREYKEINSRIVDKRISRIYSRVTPNSTFAQKVNNNNMNANFDKTNYSNFNHQDYNTGINNNNDFLIQIKNEIINSFNFKFDSMKSQVDSNTSKINQILTYFESNYE